MIIRFEHILLLKPIQTVRTQFLTTYEVLSKYNNHNIEWKVHREMDITKVVRLLNMCLLIVLGSETENYDNLPQFLMR